MGMLDQLLGGDAAKQIGSLIQQFESGNAHQVSQEEAVAHHDAVAKHLSKEDYEHAATQAAEKLTPEQRKEAGKKLAEAAKQQGHDVDSLLAQHGGDPSSSASIGKLLTALQGTPGGMGSLLSTGGLESLAGNAAVRSALVGVAAMAAKKLL
jgi:acyl-CoA reductase-like NAD-dependent aldehyde dehydrogenase